MTSREWPASDPRARTLAELEGLSEVLNAMSLAPIASPDTSLSDQADALKSLLSVDISEAVSRALKAQDAGHKVVRLRNRDGMYQVVGVDGDNLEVVRVQKVSRSEVVKPTGQ